MIKILHIGPVYNTRYASSGLNQTIRDIVSAQASIGLEVALLSSNVIRENVKIENIPNVCMLKSPTKHHRNPWHISKQWIKYIQSEFGVPNLIHFHSTYIPFHIALARKFKQLKWPYIITPHGGMNIEAQHSFKKKIGNMLFYNSYVRNAVAIHAKEQSEEKQIKSLFNPERIINVPTNAVDPSLLEIRGRSVAKKIDGLNEADLVLGFVGRIAVYIKGIDILLEALYVLKSKYNSLKFKLMMIGPFYKESDKDYVLTTIQKYGLEGNIELVGPQYGQDKWDYLLACDVLVCPSRSESGICFAILEAMSLGLPFITTLGTNMADIVEQVGGWQSQATPESIANKIMEAYKCKESLPEVGKRLQEHVRSYYTLDKVVQQLSEEYIKIIEERKTYEE